MYSCLRLLLINPVVIKPNAKAENIIDNVVFLLNILEPLRKHKALYSHTCHISATHKTYTLY